MESNDNAISFENEKRKILEVFQVFSNRKVTFKFKDDKTITLIGNGKDGIECEIDVITKDPSNESFSIYYVHEGLKIKGSLEMSKDKNKLESLQMDELNEVMVDNYNIYLYGPKSKDRFKECTWIELWDVDCVEKVK